MRGAPLSLLQLVASMMNTITPHITVANTGEGQAAPTNNTQSTAGQPSEASGLKKRGPIEITGDNGFTRENGVVSGSGTADDPYIIEGWEIDATGHKYGIRIVGTRAHFIIRNCRIYGAEKAGISLVNVGNGKITGNTITSNGFGIELERSSNNIIEHNIIENNGHGIYLMSSDDNVIAGNVFIKCGLHVLDSYDNTVVDNTVNGKPLVYLENASNQVVSGSAGQVILVNCSNITVKNLDISNTDVGIELWKTSDSIIVYNNIANNEVGIFLSLSSNNIIVYNNVTNNKFGIQIWNSINNLIFGNNFISNITQFSVFATFNRRSIGYYPISGNYWNSAYPIGGNYWSDHECTDQYSGPNQDEPGSDGICDKPYHFDRYPLAKPVDIKQLATIDSQTTTRPGKTTSLLLVLVAALLITIVVMVIALLLKGG